MRTASCDPALYIAQPGMVAWLGNVYYALSVGVTSLLDPDPGSSMVPTSAMGACLLGLDKIA
jgi:hypothetical protein